MVLLYVLYPAVACVQMFQKLSCLPYVFGSVLACAKSADMFQKLSYSLCGVCFITNNSSSDSNAFLRFIALSGSPTAVHHAFLFFDAKAWPQSQTDLFTCTTVLHCGHTFLNLSQETVTWSQISRLSSTRKPQYHVLQVT